MAQDEVNVGTGPNAGNGDYLRNAFIKINADIAELFTAVGLLAPSSSPAFSGVPESPDAVGSPPGTMIANLNYVASYVAAAIADALDDLEGITNSDLLSSLAGLSVVPADRYFYTTGNDTAAAGTITAFGRSLLDDANAAAGRTTLELGTMAVQAAADYLTIAAAAAAYQPLDSDILFANVSDNLTAGFTVDVYSAGSKSTGTFTPDPALGNMQSATNDGAHTLAPPTGNCTMIIAYTNGAAAGTITTSGFTTVSGDAPGTTSGDDFLAYITRIGSFSHLTWVALQ